MDQIKKLEVQKNDLSNEIQAMIVEREEAKQQCDVATETLEDTILSSGKGSDEYKAAEKALKQAESTFKSVSNKIESRRKTKESINGQIRWFKEFVEIRKLNPKKALGMVTKQQFPDKDVRLALRKSLRKKLGPAPKKVYQRHTFNHAEIKRRKEEITGRAKAKAEKEKKRQEARDYKKLMKQLPPDLRASIEAYERRQELLKKVLSGEIDGMTMLRKAFVEMKSEDAVMASA